MKARQESIQYLRGIAALLVVFHHTVAIGIGPSGATLPQIVRTFAGFGSIGVDIFFVISGFVMANCLARGSANLSAGHFILQRIIRIAPLYWLVTALFVCLKWSAGEGYDHIAILNALTVFPLFDAPIYHYPPLYVGWTLGFEFTLYGIVAVLIGRGARRPVPILLGLTLVAGLSGFITTDHSVPLRFVANPIVAEFSIGIVVWLFAEHGLPSPVGNICLLAGILLLLLGLDGDALHGFSIDPLLVVRGVSSLQRLVVWGLPSGFLIAGMASAGLLEGRWHRWLLSLGEASYPLYLVHPLVIAASLASGLQTWVSSPYVLIVLLVSTSIVAALLLHRFVERPLMTAAHRWPAMLLGPGRAECAQVRSLA